MNGIGGIVVAYLITKMLNKSDSGNGGFPTMHLPGGVSIPIWPTPLSPPPPVPAFQPQPTHPSAEPNVSLQDLHNAPQPIPDRTNSAHSLADVAKKKKKKPRSPGQQAADAAVLAYAKKRAAKGYTTGPLTNGPNQTVAQSVETIQRVLNARGAKLVRDGLYGPKTANAWIKAASAKGLKSEIVRRGPKLVTVNAHTYDILAVPPIP
jgi:hypothetical protein